MAGDHEGAAKHGACPLLACHDRCAQWRTLLARRFWAAKLCGLLPCPVLQKYDHLFQANEKNGSFYLQSKVYRCVWG